MEEVLEQLIADAERRPLPALTPRDVALPRVGGVADVLIGVRRGGKSWRCLQAIGELTAAGVPRQAILNLGFEDERLLPLRAADLHLVPDVFYRRHPEAHDRPVHFFFDEIQVVPGWERFVRRIVDEGRAHVTLTGSSARLLGKEIATELRGRSLATEVFPFGFVECLRHHGGTAPAAWPARRQVLELERRLDAFIEQGGFPQVQGLDDELRRRVLQGYLDVLILRDVVERYRFANVPAVRALIRDRIHAPATLFSVTKFHADLRSQGIQVSKNSLYELLGHLEDAFLLFPVPIHSAAERVRRVNPRKVYVVDTGLALACTRRTTPDSGHLLENWVFLELRRRGRTPAYYVTASGREVDFVMPGANGRPALVQAAWDLGAAETRNRELRALDEAMAELRVREALLVTRRANETVPLGGRRTVRIVPAWWWACQGAPPEMTR
jgi:predicted AAA+ superfamily ATPase